MAGAGAAAGAAVGTAIMPGVGTAVGGLLGGMLDGGGGGGSAGGGYSPQDAQSAIYGSAFGQDNSGWNVNFSGTQSNGSNKSAPSALDSLGLTGSGSVLGIPPQFLLIGAVAVIGLIVWKKSRSKG